jgi:hypothetical protein
MAAKKSASKQSSSKTPARASKKSKVEHRRPAVMPGDLAGAEYNPARTEEGDKVAATAANPSASRAGLLVAYSVPNSEDPNSKELGLKDIQVSVVDGSRARLRLGNQETAPLDQDDILALQKTLAQIVQGVY